MSASCVLAAMIAIRLLTSQRRPSTIMRGIICRTGHCGLHGLEARNWQTLVTLQLNAGTASIAPIDRIASAIDVHFAVGSSGCKRRRHLVRSIGYRALQRSTTSRAPEPTLRRASTLPNPGPEPALLGCRPRHSKAHLKVTARPVLQPVGGSAAQAAGSVPAAAVTGSPAVQAATGSRPCRACIRG